jgi:hypothetical protein
MDLEDLEFRSALFNFTFFHPLEVGDAPRRNTTARRNGNGI